MCQEATAGFLLLALVGIRSELLLQPGQKATSRPKTSWAMSALLPIADMTRVYEYTL